MRTWMMAVGVIGLLLTGCSSPRGFHRELMTASLATPPAPAVTDADIQKALDAKPTVKKPFKLGIYFMPGQKRIEEDRSYDWNWTTADKDTVVDMAAVIKTRGMVTETAFISSSLVATNDIRSIRYAAAQHGVDAVLVISGSSDTDRYNNPLGILYIGIVTAFFVPGTVVDALFISHAGLWDVRNGCLLMSVEADGNASITRPATAAREEDAVARAKRESIKLLAHDVASRISSM